MLINEAICCYKRRISFQAIINEMNINHSEKNDKNAVKKYTEHGHTDIRHTYKTTN